MLISYFIISLLTTAQVIVVSNMYQIFKYFNFIHYTCFRNVGSKSERPNNWPKPKNLLVIFALLVIVSDSPPLLLCVFKLTNDFVLFKILQEKLVFNKRKSIISAIHLQIPEATKPNFLLSVGKLTKVGKVILPPLTTLPMLSSALGSASTDRRWCTGSKECLCCYERTMKIAVLGKVNGTVLLTAVATSFLPGLISPHSVQSLEVLQLVPQNSNKKALQCLHGKQEILSSILGAKINK